MNYTYEIFKIPILNGGLISLNQMYGRTAIYEKETGYYLEMNLEYNTSSQNIPIEVKKRIIDWVKSNNPELLL